MSCKKPGCPVPGPLNSTWSSQENQQVGRDRPYFIHECTYRENNKVLELSVEISESQQLEWSDYSWILQYE